MLPLATLAEPQPMCLSARNDSTLRTRLPAQYQGGLVVGVQINQPPSSFQTSAGQLEGYDPDIFRAMSKLIGAPITIKQVTFENLLLGLESGKFDLIADTNITAPREKIYNQLSEDNDHYTLATKTGSQLISADPLSDVRADNRLTHWRRGSGLSPERGVASM